MNNQPIRHKQNTQKDKPLYCSFCNSYLNHKLQTEERRTQSSINTMHMSNHANKFLLLLSIGASAIFSISASFALVPVSVQTRSEKRRSCYNGNSHFVYSQCHHNKQNENHCHSGVEMMMKKKLKDYEDGFGTHIDFGEESRVNNLDHSSVSNGANTDANNYTRRKFIQQVLATTATATAASFIPTAFINNSNLIAKADDDVENDEKKISGSDDDDDNVEEEKENTIKKQKKETIKNPAFDPRYFIAGGGCASISHGLATPFDVIKTKIQSEPDVYDKGFLQTAQTLTDAKNGGSPAALLTGLTPTVVGFGLEGAVKFGVYESLKPVSMALLHSDDKFLPYLLASIGAGAVASIMLCPMERARIRLVTQDKNGDNDNSDESSPGLVSSILCFSISASDSTRYFSHSENMLPLLPII